MGTPGAPSRGQRITVDDIVEAGVELTASEGLPAVTVRAVAARLGVRSPSLYHHLPGGLEELRGLVVGRIQELIEAEDVVPQGATAWDRLEVPLRSVGRVTRTYPGVLEHILTAGKDGPTTLSGSERTVQLLLESELADVAPEAYVAIHAYVTGWVFAQRPSAAAAKDNGLTALARVLRNADRLDQEKVLLDGLRALLVGLAQAQQPQATKASSSARGGRTRAG
ncbi:MAG: tetR family transcriptional regulatory protein [Frankiales bacterium]|nr:tetR family transcriptional regulatory protein [Frankiales bacterium]